MKSTRDRILHTLLKKPNSTINELAESVGINPISVRHHLTNLQVEGLVEAEEERHGVGRPRLIYSLTEHGMEKFPTRYLRLTSRLLDQLKSSLPEPMVSKLFAEMATSLADEYSEQMQGLSMEERLELISDLLAEEGFTVEWEKVNDQYRIHEITCPYSANRTEPSRSLHCRPDPYFKDVGRPCRESAMHSRWQRSLHIRCASGGYNQKLIEV